MMRRREIFLPLAGAIAAPVLLSHRILAQQPGKVMRVGRLSPLSEATERPMLEGLRAGLAELGWVVGKNLAVEVRFSDGELDRLPELARDLVRQSLDVIVTGSNPGALAAKRATDKIPIVFVTTGDPVAAGIVPSLGRPGGNLTGITALGVELAAKRLEILKEMFGLKKIAVLVNPGSSYTDEFFARREGTAKALDIELPTVGVSDPSVLDAAFDKIVAQGAGGVLVLSDILLIRQRRRIVELAAARKLPAIYPDRSFVDAGGVLFYGAALPDMYRHAAIFVDKILKGAKPADLPVEQPTTFRLAVNLKAARAMGLTIPESFLARADEVIE